MVVKPSGWILCIFLLIFFYGLLFVEVSTYSLLPSDEGGMSFWQSFKFIWYNSIWFYGSLIMTIATLWFIIHSVYSTKIENRY